MEDLTPGYSRLYDGNAPAEHSTCLKLNIHPPFANTSFQLDRFSGYQIKLNSARGLVSQQIVSVGGEKKIIPIGLVLRCFS